MPDALTHVPMESAFCEEKSVLRYDPNLDYSDDLTIRNVHNEETIEVSPASRFLENFSKRLLNGLNVDFDQLLKLPIWSLPYNRPKKSVQNEVLL
ncbi:Hypothetical predicted protein [Octopus vulgaris]|uniref:Uncharacterized protein n=1 Tax=Octopus vulgaris TaxID=6645 RepID=A0AA36FB42_OCTVU|nr:Hypothetical predicted protein [Octopus vulgaris]